MKLSSLLLPFILLFGCFTLQSQGTDQTSIPLDPQVKYGTLDNGMTYYIRNNQEPKNRASFYIIQNVGSVLEEDHENGLAHFLEHMAFNGTEHFPGRGIIHTLEKYGIAFGRQINAYTSLDETIYNISEVPTDKPGLLDTCLLILYDWSHSISLNPEDIEAERGVIIEEWRTSQTASSRIRKKLMPYVYPGSMYARRDVIGEVEILKNFTPADITSFYHKWYRPDLQAIAVAGDFDPGEMERMIISRFSTIPAAADPKPREEFLIPENDEIIFGSATDPEEDQSVIYLYIREYAEDRGIERLDQLFEEYIRTLFNYMMRQRISELLQKGEPPFVSGGVSRTSLTRNYNLTSISVTAKTNQESLALTSILTEVERVKQHGFSNGELERAKQFYLNRFENRLKQKDKISNDQYISEYSAHYLNKSAFMDIELEFQLMNALFNSISTEEINTRTAGWFSGKNNVLLISGPEAEGVTHLSEEEALAILDAAEKSQVDPYQDADIAEALIETLPEKGSVVSFREIPELGAEEWILSNGAKVVYRFADYEKDNITFRAYSKGGSSLYGNDFVPSLEMLSNFVSYYGLGSFDQPTLQKMLSGKTVSLGLSLSELSEGFNGSASPKDFGVMMQLLYMRFTQPRFDEEAHQALKSRYISFIENMNKNPQKVMSDSLQLILTDYHPRTRIMDREFIEEIELSKIEQAYRERFADASDFIFFFVGNISRDELIPLVEQYIAPLPSSGSAENWIDLGINEPDGTRIKEIPLELTTPKATVFQVFNNKMKYSPENLLLMQMIQGILDLRYIETIREEEGGTYGVMTEASLTHFPEEKARLFIYFETDPEKAGYLKELVYKELDLLVEKGPEAEDLLKTTENMLKDREEEREHNAYWLNMLVDYYVNGYNFDDPRNFEEVIKDASPKDLKKLMKKFYGKANKLDIVFVPLVSVAEEAVE